MLRPYVIQNGGADGMADQARIRAEFIETVGQITQSEKLPRIAGRILGLLIFDGVPVSFGALADELQVSRGSVSTATRTLEDRGLIRRVGMPGERQDFFQLADNPYLNLMRHVKTMLERNCETVRGTAAAIEDEAARKRVQDFADFYQLMSDWAGSCLRDLTAGKK
ncbi:GbsR/MarR family transcriptional regulator [Primorskyibacter sp. 2E107]|uniref:GbsR/MarR family transcriptional regulator n=1 Tax=Primorskyibacter sp. 2E107 TaxID=3403458 RepID=UPI003AF5EF8A